MSAGAEHQFVGLHGHPDEYICDRSVELSDPRAGCLE
jgi:hypothetical protein